MKSSARGHKGKGQRCTIVDGYNVVARKAGSSLAKIADLETARRDLEDQLAQYRAVYDEDVIVVYDAQHRRGPSVSERRAGIEIIFTDAGETADARIERLVYEIRENYRDITVATSDAAEQQVSFGGGALRISANELLLRLDNMQRYIRKQTDESNTGSRRMLSDSIRDDVAKALEKWRRK
ncbi:NYN domain-containing protein [Alicyclobacillus dauci]|uniref:NYN domain-containing protein n=1 Tax=Alicyclobacillus dauci TaxID=1475485 RepID=A0ABY6Z3P6_9BACL|nr:NYN domain-containing protein [Alicyclobacillus dauci]WAH37375.1 NYN domain-containing protein [Alicyclobacillus dauci]